MPDPKTQAWDFGDAPPSNPTDISRDDLLNKTRNAAASVGYVPHEERPKRQTRRTISRTKTKPDDQVRARGRPRKSRSIPLSTKITPEHDALLKAIAADGLVIADIVAEALDTFARELVKSRLYKRFPLDDSTMTKAIAVVDSSKDP